MNKHKGNSIKNVKKKKIASKNKTKKSRKSEVWLTQLAFVSWAQLWTETKTQTKKKKDENKIKNPNPNPNKEERKESNREKGFFVCLASFNINSFQGQTCTED